MYTCYLINYFINITKKRYVSDIHKPDVNKKGGKGLLLVYQFEAYTTSEVMKEIQDIGFQSIVVLAVFTSKLQSLDVFVNKRVKEIWEINGKSGLSAPNRS